MIPRSEIERFEKIPARIFQSAEEASLACAKEIAELIRSRSSEGRQAVLGLATGSTPVGVYQELIRMHREEGLSFQSVITFNLDEYYGLEREHRESYYRFMHEQLFNHVDIPAENVHIPDGTVPREDVFDFCLQYEEAIEKAGGIDLQLLGIGRTGHIGFNEPGVEENSITSLVALDPVTRRDAARDFLDEANVPRFAITMGVGSILKAKKVILMAWGKGKAEVVKAAVEGPITSQLPASFLQKHANVRFFINEPAAAELTRIQHPWLTGTVEWKPRLLRQAVLWLADKVDKPILKLVEADYTGNGLQSLLAEVGTAYELNIRIFNEIQHTISGWPGGKPSADDSTRPERAKPFPKRVVLLAPEPMEDVAHLGGALSRLISQGHDLNLLYQTSGSLAVPDEEALMAAGFVRDSAQFSSNPGEGVHSFASEVRAAIEGKGENAEDTPRIRQFKSIIRRGEARAACACCGLTAERIEFLDQQFYEQGRYRQFRFFQEDLDQLVDRLTAIQPHQIYATGDLADPSSVAGFAFQILLRALEQLSGEDWMKDCRVWLYRGDGREWEPHEIDMAMPLSPDELNQKIRAVYQHKSQRNQIPTLGGKHREYWQQIEAVNRQTAERYDQLGLAEYEALEAFRRWK
jgi:glucosamine-6-phosphate deaminase